MNQQKALNKWKENKRKIKPTRKVIIATFSPVQSSYNMYTYLMTDTTYLCLQFTGQCPACFFTTHTPPCQYYFRNLHISAKNNSKKFQLNRMNDQRTYSTYGTWIFFKHKFLLLFIYLFKALTLQIDESTIDGLKSPKNTKLCRKLNNGNDGNLNNRRKEENRKEKGEGSSYGTLYIQTE